jgi:polar amino acid transport system substrate-binding protein
LSLALFGALGVSPAVERSRAAEAGQGVVVPNFWDPKRRLERPPADTVPVIRFATTDDFPPFNFLDAEGHLTGFNVDLARAICAELAIRCTIQARPWNNLVETLTNKTADAAIAGMAISGEARSQLDFSDVYMRSPARFVARRDAAKLDLTPDGLKGKTLAVVARTAHEAYLAAFFPEVERKLYPTADAARQALKSGVVDAHFGDGEQLSFWLAGESAAGCCVFVGGPYLESRFFGLGMTIAMAKGSTDLKRAIDSALEAIYDKGVYAELYLRYFPVGFF